MNTGAEAVESGIKVARKWGYEVKGVPPDRARIVVAAGGFHGRTTTIVGFSTDPDARGGFGPFTPGFDVVPYGDADALRAAITPDTVAVLLEPIQGEAGVIVPPAGYLAAVRADLRRGRRAVRGRRGAVRARPHRAPAGHPGRRASTPTSTCSARPWAAGSCRCRRWSPTPMCSACCAPASTAAPSAATRWPARSAGPCSSCWPMPGRTACSPGPPARATQLHGRLAGLVGHGVVAVRGRRPVGRCRPRPGAAAAAGRSARRWPGAACWSRTPTARPSGSRRRWCQRGRAGPRGGRRWPKS